MKKNWLRGHLNKLVAEKGAKADASSAGEGENVNVGGGSPPTPLAALPPFVNVREEQEVPPALPSPESQASETPVAVIHVASTDQEKKRKSSFSGFFSRTRSSMATPSSSTTATAATTSTFVNTSPPEQQTPNSPVPLHRFSSAPAGSTVYSALPPEDGPVNFTVSYNNITPIPFAIPVTTTSVATTPAILVSTSPVLPSSLTPSASPSSTLSFAPFFPDTISSTSTTSSFDPVARDSASSTNATSISAAVVSASSASSPSVVVTAPLASFLALSPSVSQSIVVAAAAAASSSYHNQSSVEVSSVVAEAISSSSSSSALSPTSTFPPTISAPSVSYVSFSASSPLSDNSSSSSIDSPGFTPQSDMLSPPSLPPSLASSFAALSIPLLDPSVPSSSSDSPLPRPSSASFSSSSPAASSSAISPPTTSTAAATGKNSCLSFASFVEEQDEEQAPPYSACSSCSSASSSPQMPERPMRLVSLPPSLYPTDKKAMTKEEEEKILRDLRQPTSPSIDYPDDGGTHVHGKNFRPRRISLATQQGGVPASASSPSLDQDLKARWMGVLSQYDNDVKVDTEVMELLKIGMPSSVRPYAWDLFSGAKEMSESHPLTYYRQLIAVYEAKGGSQSHKEIVKDIRRTLVDVPYFQTSQGLESLTRVLSAYCLRNPESVGYCQSINQIAGALLMVLEGNEEKAFWILVCMIENRLGYYCKSMCGLTVDQRVLNSLLKFNHPRLFKHLEAQQCSISDISVPWFMCLCVEAPVPIDLVPQFWDRLFLLGDSALFGLALALLALKEKEIMAIDEDLLMYFKGGARAPINSGVDWQALYCEITISEELVEKIAQLRVFHRAEVVKSERIFNVGTAQKHAQQLKTTVEEVQNLWQCFLEPTPWETLLQYCLTSVISFSQAFCCKVFSPEQRARWHEEGLFSGVIHRLFDLFDVYSHKKISFDQFLKGALVFMQGTNQERCDLAFRFFDVQNIGVVSSEELRAGFHKFHLMYNGDDGTAEQATSSFVDLILHKTANANAEEKDEILMGKKVEGSWGMGTGLVSGAKNDRNKRSSLDVGKRKTLFVQPVAVGGLVRGANGDIGLDLATFSKYIAYHPFCQMFFGLGQPD